MFLTFHQILSKMVIFQQGGWLDVDTKRKEKTTDKHNYTAANTNGLHVI